jgi:hypothetical protein
MISVITLSRRRDRGSDAGGFDGYAAGPLSTRAWWFDRMDRLSRAITVQYRRSRDLGLKAPPEVVDNNLVEQDRNDSALAHRAALQEPAGYLLRAR